MVAQSLRERIDIQDFTAASDGAGGQTITWADTYSSVPAQVQPVRGREEERLGREVTFQTYLITIRHGYTVTTLSRVVWNSNNLNIRSVENRDMRSRFLTLVCDDGPTT